MSSRDRIWQYLHELFDADDGSLPEFVVAGLTPTAVVAGYQRLVTGATLISIDAMVHDRVRGQDLPLAATSDPASGVVRGELEPFHVVFGGVRSLTTTLPAIGVSVFSDQLVLDYRMGPEWTPETVEAFLFLLAELAKESPAGRVELEEGVPRFWIERFERAWVEAELGRGAT